MTEFNWVTERAKCSLAAVFEQLRLWVQDDIEERQSLRAKDSIDGEGFSHGFHVSTARNSFSVMLAGQGRLDEKPTVIFTLEENSIAVSAREDKLLFRFTVTLNREGRCVAKMGGSGNEMEFWQIRHKALEALFFESGVPFNTPL
jgi:hypothetical protein